MSISNPVLHMDETDSSYTSGMQEMRGCSPYTFSLPINYSSQTATDDRQTSIAIIKLDQPAI